MTHFLSHLLLASLPVAANVFGQARNLMRDLLSAIHGVVGNWGVAIILLTIIVRIVIFPLTWKQIRSQLAMQSLQPKIKELQQRYKKDKQKLQQETMRLYQEYRINPFASCLPLLLQMPVFILLFYAIRGYAPLQNAHFLWFTLGQPDPYYVLLIIYVVSQLVSTELMMTPETMAQQKWMMRAMPLVFVVFLHRFPSGLFVYWITTNLWTVGQVLFIRYWRTHHPVKLVPADQSNKKPSRFMQAMQQAQQDREKQGTRGSRSAQGRGKSGARAAQGGQKKGGRPAGKPGSRPGGSGGAKQAGGQRPSGGKPSGGKPGQTSRGGAKRAPGEGKRPPGPPSAAPGQGRPGGTGGQQGGSGARPGGRPGGRPQGKPGGKPSQEGRRRTRGPERPQPGGSGN